MPSSSRDLLRDTLRVLKPGGRLLHEWSNGEPDEEWVQIREKIRAMFEQEGVTNAFHPGVRIEGEAETFLLPVSVGMFLRLLVGGECSYTCSARGGRRAMSAAAAGVGGGAVRPRS